MKGFKHWLAVAGLILLFSALCFAFDPIKFSGAMQDDFVDWVSYASAGRQIANRKIDHLVGEKGNPIYSVRVSGSHVPVPAFGSSSLISGELLSDRVMTQHNRAQRPVYGCGKFEARKRFICNSGRDNRQYSMLKSSKDGTGNDLSIESQNRSTSVNNEVVFHLSFHTLTPRGGKLKHEVVRCMFAVTEPGELSLGQCMTVPVKVQGLAALGIKDPTTGVVGDGEYELLAKCGDLTTVIEIPPFTDEGSAVGGHSEFILRRVKSNYTSEFGLCEAWQADSDNQHRSYENVFHLHLDSSEGSVMNYSPQDRTLRIAGERLFISKDGVVWYKLFRITPRLNG